MQGYLPIGQPSFATRPMFAVFKGAKRNQNMKWGSIIVFSSFGGRQGRRYYDFPPSQTFLNSISVIYLMQLDEVPSICVIK